MLKRGASKIEEKARENMEEEGLDDTEAKMWLAGLNSKCVTCRGRLASRRVLDSSVQFTSEKAPRWCCVVRTRHQASLSLMSTFGTFGPDRAYFIP